MVEIEKYTKVVNEFVEECISLFNNKIYIMHEKDGISDLNSILFLFGKENNKKTLDIVAKSY